MAKTMVTIECPQCGLLSEKTLSRVTDNNKRGIKTYCSRACWAKSQTMKCGGAIERLMSRYQVSDSGCWEWTGTKNAKGYGFIQADAKRWMTHRYSYHIHHGQIPDGMFVCHKCDNPKCINPDHLFAGTQKDNMNDMVKKGRAHKVGRSGTENPNNKLTEQDVLAIRAAWGVSCKSYPQIVKQFGLKSSGHARKIITRMIWNQI